MSTIQQVGEGARHHYPTEGRASHGRAGVAGRGADLGRCCTTARARALRLMSAGWDSVDSGGCEELEGDAVGVAERDSRPVGRVLDPVMRDAQFGEAICPALQLVATTA